jgi:hypothetical protein
MDRSRPATLLPPHRAEQIGLERGAGVIQRSALQPVQQADAGIVDQRIDRTRESDGLGDTVFAGDIKRKDAQPVADRLRAPKHRTGQHEVVTATSVSSIMTRQMEGPP